MLAAYCAAMAQRVAGLIERMQVEREFFITGGIGKNIGVTRRIERLIGVEAVKLPADSVLDPQIAGAWARRSSPTRCYRKAQKEAAAAGDGSAPPAAGEAAADRRSRLGGHGLMIANYGYEDGSGFYYITIDGDVCARVHRARLHEGLPRGGIRHRDGRLRRSRRRGRPRLPEAAA